MKDMDNSNFTELEGNIDLSEVDGKYLTFWTDSQLFGVPIADVVQIVQMQEITEVPNFPYYAKGIMNLRDSIIPVIDLRLRFGKPEAAYTDRTCIIVTNIRNRLIGTIVDQVDEVTLIDEQAISQAPELTNHTTSQYLTGIGKQHGRVILLLDTDRILNGEQLDSLTQ